MMRNAANIYQCQQYERSVYAISNWVNVKHLFTSLVLLSVDLIWSFFHLDCWLDLQTVDPQPCLRFTIEKFTFNASGRRRTSDSQRPLVCCWAAARCLMDLVEGVHAWDQGFSGTLAICQMHLLWPIISLLLKVLWPTTRWNRSTAHCTSLLMKAPALCFTDETSTGKDHKIQALLQLIHVHGRCPHCEIIKCFTHEATTVSSFWASPLSKVKRWWSCLGVRMTD